MSKKRTLLRNATALLGDTLSFDAAAARCARRRRAHRGHRARRHAGRRGRPSSISRSRLLVPGLVNGHQHSHEHFQRGRTENLPLELWMHLVRTRIPVALTPRQVYLRTMIGAIESLRTGCTTLVDDMALGARDRPRTHRRRAAGLRGRGHPRAARLRDDGQAHRGQLPLRRGALPARARGRAARRAAPGAGGLPGAGARSRAGPPSAAAARRRAGVGLGAAAVHGGLPDGRARPRGRAGAAGHHARAGDADAGRDRAALLRLPHRRVPRPHRLPEAGHQPDPRGVAQPARDRRARAQRRHRAAQPVEQPDAGLGRAAGARAAGRRRQREPGLGRLVLDRHGQHAQRAGQRRRGVEAPRRRALALALGARGAACRHRWPAAGRSASARSLGSLRVGAIADLVAYRTDTVTFTPFNDPVRQLVYAERGAGLDFSMVAGEIAIERGALTRIDEAALLREIENEFHTLAGSTPRPRPRWRRCSRRSRASTAARWPPPSPPTPMRARLP